jgi:hypothetical protein
MLTMKHRWGVSLQAIVHRAFDIGLIDATQYRTASIHVQKYGWKTVEPGEEPLEEPGVCASFIAELQKRSAIADLCSSADLYPADVGLTLGLRVEESIDMSGVLRMRHAARSI